MIPPPHGGAWPAAGLPEAVEILWEDGTDTPHAQQLAPASFDLLPAEPPPGREWLKPWEGTTNA